MSHADGNEFVKKSEKLRFAREGTIFTGVVDPPSSKVFVDPGKIGSYTLPEIPHPDSVETVMTGREKLKFMVMRTIGNFLVLFCLYGVISTFGPALYYEVQYQVIKLRGIEYKVAKITNGNFSKANNLGANILPLGFGDVIAGAKEQVLIPPDTQFSIIIPKLGATAKVWPNVDPLDEANFLPKLKTGVAHAKGSVFPGMEGNVYLFAHSTDNFWDVGRYNAVFYLLKDLKPGDDISVYFENVRHNYRVDHTVIKDPDDVDLLVHSQVPGKEQLILQTCWPPGTTWKRLFVIATPQR